MNNEKIPLRYNDEIIGYIDDVIDEDGKMVGSAHINPDKMDMFNALLNQGQTISVSSRVKIDNETDEQE